MYKAGFWIRLGAGVLDSLIISIPLVIIAGVTGNFDTDEPIAKLLSALYSIYLPVYWYGRTIGKLYVEFESANTIHTNRQKLVRC